jgi:translocation and assembly module TamB
VILGELRLKRAGFRPAGMEERFRDVDALILLQDTLITIKQLKGREGKDGSFTGSGKIELEGWRPRLYDIDLKVDRCLFASISNVMAIASGNIHIGTEMIDGKPVPSLTGDLEVNRAEVFLVLDELTSGTPSGVMTPSLLALIDLDIPGNAWIKTPDSNIEMRGEVTLHHDQRGTYLRGTLDLVRGWYNVYGNKFKVKSGKLEFVHAGGFRPVVDIEAETLDPEGRKIFLSLLWLQDDIEPKVTLVHEDPGYSETDIWKMLGGGIIASPGEEDGWDAMGTAQNLAANYIERALNSQMQGITIELETEGVQDGTTNGTEQKQTMVAVGKYLSEGLYVKYRQGLAISTVRQIDVEYRISRLFLLRTQMIKYSEATMQGESSRSTDEYNVDLKLRWEF